MDIDHDGIGEVCDPHPTHAPVYPGQQPSVQVARTIISRSRS